MANVDVVKAAELVNKLNPLIEQVVRAFTAFITARRAAVAANPTLPDGTLPTAAEVFEKMVTSAGMLEDEVKAAQERIAALPPMKPTGLDGGSGTS